MPAYESSPEHRQPPELPSEPPILPASFTSIHYDGGNETWPLTTASTSALEHRIEGQALVPQDSAEHTPETDAQVHEQQAEQPFLARHQLENAALINEVTALSPAIQVQRLAEIAAKIPGTTLRTKAEAMKLIETPANPLFTEVYSEAISLPVRRPDRLDVLIAIARKEPEVQVAWDGAVASAEALGVFANQHGFEKIAASETNGDRLDTLLSRTLNLQPHEQIPALRSLALAYLQNTPPGAKMDRYELALRLLEQLPGPVAQNAIDETRVGLVEHIAKQHGDLIHMYRTVESISEPMKPYAQLKMATHFYGAGEDTGQQAWSDVTNAIHEYWHQYPPRLQKAIIKDMCQAGQFDQAVSTLYLPTPPHQRATSDRYLQRELLMDVARAQAVTDPSKSLAILNNLQVRTEALLDYLADSQPGDDEIDIATHSVRLDENHNFLNRIIGHRTAIHAQHNYPHAINSINQFQPYGAFGPRGRDEYLGIVAPALAAAGHTADALALANAVYANDDIFGRNRQAKTYIKVAKAIYDRERKR